VLIMPIGDVCIREVVTASRGTTIQEACGLMRHHHVGNVVVIEDYEGASRPVGIITDRDIVVSVIALGLTPNVFSLGDLLSHPLVSAQQDQGIFECIRHMRMSGVRRMPIVDHSGGLVGIVSVDDLIQLLAEEMGELAQLISKEQAQEAQTKI